MSASAQGPPPSARESDPIGLGRTVLRGVGDSAKSDHPRLIGWFYRDRWWIPHDPNGAFAARGVHGPRRPDGRETIVRFASHPVAGNAADDPTSLPAYPAVAHYLMSQD